MNSNQLGLLLVREKVISRNQLDDAVQNLGAGESLLERLLQKGMIGDQVVSQFLSEKLSFPMADRNLLEGVSLEVLRSVPRDLIDEFSFVPVGSDKTGLRVAMVDPTNKTALEEIKFFLGKNISAIVGNRQHIYSALNRHYHLNRVLNPIHEEPQVPPIPKVASLTPSPSLPKETPIPSGPATQSSPNVVGVDMTYQRTLEQVDLAKSKDLIAQIFLEFAARLLRRVVFFTVKKNVLLGWMGQGQDLQQKNLKGIMIPLNSPSVFQRVFESKVYFQGEVPVSSVNQIFLTALGTLHPKHVLAIPICIGERVVCIFYGDHGEEGLPTEGLHYLHLLIPKVERAFERLILNMKSPK